MNRTGFLWRLEGRLSSGGPVNNGCVNDRGTSDILDGKGIDDSNCDTEAGNDTGVTNDGLNAIGGVVVL